MRARFLLLLLATGCADGAAPLAPRVHLPVASTEEAPLTTDELAAIEAMAETHAGPRGVIGGCPQENLCETVFHQYAEEAGELASPSAAAIQAYGDFR